MKILSAILMITLTVILFTQESQIALMSPLLKWFILGVGFLLALILFGGKSGNRSDLPKDFIKRASYEDKHKDHIDGAV